MIAYTGRLRPKGVPFSGFGYVKLKVGISQVEVYKRVRKSDTYVFKRALIIIFRVYALMAVSGYLLSTT